MIRRHPWASAGTILLAAIPLIPSGFAYGLWWAMQGRRWWSTRQ